MEEEILLKNQPILSRILNNINNSKKNSTAYILVGENTSYLKKYSILFSKILVCPSKYNEKCEKCNICKRIDENIFSEVKIISPENNVIKKEKILELRNYFIKESVEGRNNVYIINDIDNLNMAAANSILKFLEEPDSNVVAIFNTTNLNKVIPTISSRCQIIKINNIRTKYGVDFVKDLTKLEEDEIYDVLSFIKKIELDKNIAFSEIKTNFIDKFDTREKVKSILKVMLLLYKDMLNYKIRGECIYFNINDFKRLLEINTTEKITRKISFILENLSKIEYNVNILLFISNLIIGIGDI